MLIAGLVLALVFLGVSRAITAEFDTPQSRVELAEPHRRRAADPPGHGRQGRQRRHPGRLPPVQVRRLLPARAEPVVDPGPVGHARRRGAARQPRVRGFHRPLAASDRDREAVGPPPGARASCVLVVFAAIAIAGSAFPVLPGDEISVLSAFAYAIWLGLLALVAGAIAFALGPFVGRGAAAGIAGVITFAGFILNGYQAAVPELAPFANLTWWGWTSDHIALAGQYDWLPVIAGGGRGGRPARGRHRGVRAA